LLIIDEDLIAAAGYKIYIEHLISIAQHLWSYINYSKVTNDNNILII
jgi:hypothetical protein